MPAQHGGGDPCVLIEELCERGTTEEVEVRRAREQETRCAQALPEHVAVIGRQMLWEHDASGVADGLGPAILADLNLYGPGIFEKPFRPGRGGGSGTSVTRMVVVRRHRGHPYLLAGPKVDGTIVPSSSPHDCARRTMRDPPQPGWLQESL